MAVHFRRSWTRYGTEMPNRINANITLSRKADTNRCVRTPRYIPATVRSQLGLDLVKKRALLSIFVLDHLEKPSIN
jgi:uncharacterized protein (TIGR03435 family)